MLVVEDVITTGGSTRETARVAAGARARRWSARRRSSIAAPIPARLNLPLQALVQLDVPDLRPRRRARSARQGRCPSSSREHGRRHGDTLHVGHAHVRSVHEHLHVSRTLKFTLQYDGTDYVGWQRQAERGVDPGAARGGAGADRGRAGDGARRGPDRCRRPCARTGGQRDRSSTRIDERTLARALNAVLPPDVRVLSIEEAAPDFHARFRAVAKTYEYRIVNAPIVSAFLRRYVWHVPQPLDLEAMRTAAGAAGRPPRLRRLPGRRDVRGKHRCARSSRSMSKTARDSTCRSSFE